LTLFSPSPTHLLVNVEADILKNVEPDSLAIAFPIIVFPVPGLILIYYFKNNFYYFILNINFNYLSTVQT